MNNAKIQSFIYGRMHKQYGVNDECLTSSVEVQHERVRDLDQGSMSSNKGHNNLTKLNERTSCICGG